MADGELDKDIICVCKKTIKQKDIFRHFAKSNLKCKEKFGDEKLATLELERKKSLQDAKSKRNKSYYSENSSPLKKRQKVYYAENTPSIVDKQREYDGKNRKRINERQSVYNKQHSKRIKETIQDKRNKAKDDMTNDSRIIRFKRAIIEGPNFICYNCNRAQFKSGIVTVKVKNIQKPDAEIKLDEDFLREVGLFDLDDDLDLTFCHKCINTIRERKVPDISVINGLQIDQIPPDLNLTDLEQQLIAKTLLFLKIKKLPKTRMKQNIAKVVIVPIESEDVQNTVAQLPRHPDDAQIIAVQLKRKLEYKNSHLSQYIRPSIILKALTYFKEIGNVFYQDIKINPDFLDERRVEMSKQSQTDDGVSNTTIPNSQNLEGTSQILDKEKDPDLLENSDEEFETRLNAVKKFQSNQNSSTCLVPEDLAYKVVVNKSSAAITKQGIAIAPGEGKIPSNLMREDFFDVKAFPRHHPSGKFGLDHSRMYKLTPKHYFEQRLLNADERFQKDPCYVFMASYYLERRSIEGQINISGLKGSTKLSATGERQVQLKDPYSIFTDIKGTPKYWQKAKNELIAKIAQLGSFHIFYTFSCAEMRWTEVFLTLLKRKGYKIEYPSMKDWNGNDAEILIEDPSSKIQYPLWQFVNDIMGEKKHDLFNEYTLVITRIFDERVKCFIKHILMSRGKDKVPMEYYSYRVEFQARGLPHIHGVAWIEKKFLINELGIKGDFCDHLNKVRDLADKLISCQIPDNNKKLADIINDVQTHGHTTSCLKRNGICRYGFPRLPCPRTVIARPLPKSMDKEEKKSFLSRAKETLTKARAILEEENLDENMSFETFLKKIDKDLTEAQYISYIETTERGLALFLKRRVKERNINNFHPEMLAAWNANMDIQIALDPFAIIAYIVSYVNKIETGTTAFLKQALSDNVEKETKEKLHALKNAYAENREVGFSEAVYRAISSLHLKQSNVGTVYVSTGFPQNRSIMHRRVKDENEDLDDDLENSDDDEEQQSSSKPGLVSVEGYSGKFQPSVSIHDRYAKRPEYIETMCLAQFATLYTYTASLPKKKTPVIINGCSKEKSSWQTIYNSTTFLPYYLDLEDLGYMKLKSGPQVLRFHVSSKKEGHEEQYSDMLLFSSWRNEETELNGDNPKKCITSHRRRRKEIERNMKALFPGKKMMEKLESEDIQDLRPIHIIDFMDSQGQQENEEDMEEGAIDDPDYESMGYIGNINPEAPPGKESVKFKKIHVPGDDDLRRFTRSLVPEQMKPMRKVIARCKAIFRNRGIIQTKQEPIHLIIHGGAGKVESFCKYDTYFLTSVFSRCW